MKFLPISLMGMGCAVATCFAGGTLILNAMHVLAHIDTSRAWGVLCVLGPFGAVAEWAYRADMRDRGRLLERHGRTTQRV